jgi:hypothetical protein
MKISNEHLTQAILKAGAMNLKQKEDAFDEIFREQPNILASILVQQKMGNSLEQMETLLNILLVAHIALKEAQITIALVTEELQNRELDKLIAHVRFGDDLENEQLDDSIKQYIANHNETWLLAFAYTEMDSAGFTKLLYENSKYLLMAGINIVNCISASKAVV